MLNGQIISDKELSGKIVKNEELFNHEYLYNRNAYDAHPIHAITGLKEKLTELENKAPNDFKLIKAEISRILSDISDESTRTQRSEKQIQADIDKLTKALLAVQNDKKVEKLTTEIIELRTENSELKNELVEAVNKVSEGLVEQISLLQGLSDAVDTRVTDLTKADIELKESFSEKFINTEASISVNMDTITEIEKRVASQETALAELRAELEALNSTPEAPSSGLLDLLVKTFVTTEDIITVEQNIADLKNRITDLESSINGNDGVLSRVDALETQVGTIHTNIQTLSTDANNSKINIAANEDTAKANKEKLQNAQFAIENNSTAISTLKNEISSLRTTMELIEEDVDTNSINITELATIKATLSDLKSDVIQFRTELSEKIQREVNLLADSLDKVSSSVYNITTNRLPEISDDIADLQVNVQDIRESTEKLNKIVEPLVEVVKDFEGTAEALRDIDHYIACELESTNDEIVSVKNTNAKQQLDIEELKLRIKNLISQESINKDDITSLLNTVNEHSDEIKTLNNAIDASMPDSLYSQIETNRLSIDSNNHTIATLISGVNTLDEKNKSLDTALARERDTNFRQNVELSELADNLRNLNTFIFGVEGAPNDSLDASIKDLQNQINNISSVFRFVGIIDTATTEVATNGKPLHLKIEPAPSNNQVTLKDSLHNSVYKPYEAQPGDVVLVELFNTHSEKKESLGYAEFVYINQDWEELGNIQNFEAQMSHMHAVIMEENDRHKNTVNTKLALMETNINNHIANDFETRSLIFSSLDEATTYARGMDQWRFPFPEGVEEITAARTNAYPGLIVTVVTEGIYESYIIKEDRSLVLISGGGGGGTPDKFTDTQYCVQVKPGSDFNHSSLADFIAPNAAFVRSIDIPKANRKNNQIYTHELSGAGGYVFYVSKLENLNFTTSGFEAGFTRSATPLYDGYYVYRSNQKLVNRIEITIN